MEKKIAVIVGSLRKESFNRKIANALLKLAPNTLKLEILEIGQLPLYNEDLESPPPQVWVDFRNRVKGFDGVLFVTPEYNRSIPGPLKNAIDVASRPYGQNVWDKKPTAVISASTGAAGGFGANHHLRQALVFVNMPTMQQPEAYIGHASKLFDDTGAITNDSTKVFLTKFVEAFAEWVALFPAS